MKGIWQIGYGHCHLVDFGEVGGGGFGGAVAAVDAGSAVMSSGTMGGYAKMTLVY